MLGGNLSELGQKLNLKDWLPHAHCAPARIPCYIVAAGRPKLAVRFFMESHSATMLVLAVAATVVGPVGVEITGYVWHRFVEHHGWLGRVFTHRHWIHHEVAYPVQRLRAVQYHDAHSWGWYVMMSGLLGVFYLLLPLPIAIAAGAGSLIYGWVVINYFHSAFHVRGHWLKRHAWFRRLTRLHDIHHFERANYGILFFGIDKLCGTFRAEFPHKKQDIF